MSMIKTRPSEPKTRVQREESHNLCIGHPKCQTLGDEFRVFCPLLQISYCIFRFFCYLCIKKSERNPIAQVSDTHLCDKINTTKTVVCPL